MPKLRGKAKLIAARERLFINHGCVNMQLLYLVPNLTPESAGSSFPLIWQFFFHACNLYFVYHVL